MLLQAIKCAFVINSFLQLCVHSSTYYSCVHSSIMIVFIRTVYEYPVNVGTNVGVSELTEFNVSSSDLSLIAKVDSNELSLGR